MCTILQIDYTTRITHCQEKLILHFRFFCFHSKNESFIKKSKVRVILFKNLSFEIL